MGAHVPAVGKQRHRVERDPCGNLDDHHRGGDPNDDPSAPFSNG